jgi:hypothetical protein
MSETAEGKYSPHVTMCAVLSNNRLAYLVGRYEIASIPGLAGGAVKSHTIDELEREMRKLTEAWEAFKAAADPHAVPA